MPGELDKNIRKAIKGLKVSDISKVKKISGMDPKLQALAEEILKVSPRVQKKEISTCIYDGRGWFGHIRCRQKKSKKSYD